MTREEAIKYLERADITVGMKVKTKTAEAIDMAVEALKFAQWVADEIIDEELWELNYGAFAEIACRKLAKLGIVRENGNQWELVEQESEVTE